MTLMKRVVALFEALPTATRGIFWMIFATIFYAGSYGTIRQM